MRVRLEYPSNLSDLQWKIIKRLLPQWNGWGRRPIVIPRAFDNGHLVGVECPGYDDRLVSTSQAGFLVRPSLNT